MELDGAVLEEIPESAIMNAALIAAVRLSG